MSDFQTIRIEGPGKNALGTALMADLVAQIDAAGAAPLLFTGSGDAFSAGLDLKEVHAADLDGMHTFLTRLTDLLVRIFHHPAPTVAAVNGHAIAGGCLIAMLCDFRVCTDAPRARLGLNEVALGLRFPPRVLRLARSRLSPVHETAILLGAGLHGPEDALRLGLVDELSSEPLVRAEALVTALARHPADAYAAAKKALRGPVDVDDPEGDARFVDEVLPVWSGPAIKATIAGFLKR
jgi:enoyl-CoA hydratase/carnithine racemase